MRAVAHSPSFAKKVGVPMSVGREFTKSGGGMAESKAMMKKEVAFMKKKGAPKSMVKHEMTLEDIDPAWWEYRTRFARLVAAYAADTWNPRSTPLCGWCPVRDCEYHPKH